MNRTTGLCLAFGLLAMGGLFLLFVLPTSSDRSIRPGTTASDSAGQPERSPEDPPAPPEPAGTGAGEAPEIGPEPEPGPPAGTGGQGTILGRVATITGDPVEGALAYWMRASELTIHRDDLTARDRTGEDGSFEIPTAELRGVLLVRAKGYRTAVVPATVLAGEETDVGTVTLDAGFAIAGRIVDTDGIPVVGAEAVAFPAVEWADPDLLPGAPVADRWGARATTDERGEFAMTGLSEGTYRIRPEGLGVVPAKAPQEIRAGAANVTLVVRRVRVATGLVVAEADRDEGIPGATVSVELRAPAWGQALIVKTDEDGRFVLDLSAGKYADPDLRVDLAVGADGYEDYRVEGLRPDQVAPDADLVIPLVRAADLEPGSLRGRVLYDTGDPFVGRITLSFSREGRPSQVFRVETGEDGAYVVTGITPGEYRLRTAPRSDRVLRDTGKRLVIPPGGEESADLTIPRGGDVKLTVLDARGDEIPDLRVQVLDAGGEEIAAWTGGLSGHVLPDLPPGEVTVRVSARSFAPAERVVTVTKDDVTPLRIVLDPR